MANKALCSIPDCGKFARSRIATCAKHRPDKPSPKKVGRKPYAITKPCSIAGCSGNGRLRGYCLKHYKRWYKYGDPLGGSTEWGAAKAFLDRLSIEPQGDDCIAWPYSRNNQGAGQIRIKKKSHLVARVVCSRVHGLPPTPKHQAAHSCGKGHEGCVNPNHLEWKTQTQNEADKIGHGTAWGTRKHHWAKLTVEQVQAIRLRHASGEARTSIARDFGVSAHHVWQICSRRCWPRA